MEEVFLSVDIEADGKIPGMNSMLSLGSVLFQIKPDGYEVLATFEANLQTLPQAVTDPETMRWWQGYPVAWEKCRQNQEAPEVVMRRYAEWLDEHSSQPIFIGYPASYDFMFVYWYLYFFTGKASFGYAALDIKSYAMATLKAGSWTTFRKSSIPEYLQSKHPHDHTPLNDAMHQAELFANLYRENIKRG